MNAASEHDRDHPITIEPAGGRVIVRANGKIIAESVDALVLREASYGPVLYIPRGDVAMSELVPSETSTHCPYKGDANYFSTAEGDTRDAAWSYEDPFERMSAIRMHVAFYPDCVEAIEMTSR